MFDEKEIQKLIQSWFTAEHNKDGPSPYASVDNMRDAILDGHFDLTALAVYVYARICP